MNSDNVSPLKKKSILVVDDDEQMTVGISKYLTSRGFEVVTAADGQEGLQKAKEQAPSLVILDVMMPKIDGWSLIRHLRIIPELTFAPIIFLSGLGSEKDRLKGFQLGADDFLPKPFTFEELEVRVRKALDHAENLKKSIEEELSNMSKENFAFKGSLQDMSISSLITLCILENRSGVLTLTRPDAEKGIVNIYEGEVISAHTEGKEILENEEAIHDMMSWPEGQFNFQNKDTKQLIKKISTGTVTLLLESVERFEHESS